MLNQWVGKKIVGKGARASEEGDFQLVQAVVWRKTNFPHAAYLAGNPPDELPSLSGDRQVRQ